MMFGKPIWFAKQTGRDTVRAASWQGNLYRLGWMLAVSIPTVILISMQRAPEGFVWLAVSGSMCAWDWHQLKRQIVRSQDKSDQNENEVFYLGDDDLPSKRPTTNKYRLFSKN